jgi:hypothetical protein
MQLNNAAQLKATTLITFTRKSGAEAYRECRDL